MRNWNENAERHTAARRCLLRFASVVCAILATPAQAVSLVVERLDGAFGVEAVADILAGRHDAAFVGEDYAAITPTRDGGRWYRVRLASDWNKPAPPVLSVFDPQGLRVQAWLPGAETTGPRSIYDPGDELGFTRHALVFMLPAGLRADQAIVLRVESERAIPRRIAVESVTEARRADIVRARLDVLFPSVQLATLLVMLSFFLALRERMYAWYVVSMLVIVVYELYAFGLGFELPPFSLLAPLGARATWAAAACALVLLIQFAREYLELTHSARGLDRVLATLRWPLLALTLCALLPPFGQGWWVEDMIVFSALLAAPLLCAAGMLAWQRGGRRGGYFLCAWIPGLLLTLARALQLMLHWPLPEWLEFALPATLAFASLVLAFGLAEQTLTVRHERDVAHRLAEHDMLTGVLNRRAVLARLRSAFADARASGKGLAVLFLDLDHFKRINDSFGHRTGDQCLRAVIGPISGELRQGDAFGRWGGEEFLVVLPAADAEKAASVAERIRTCIETLPLLVSGARVGLTMSIGIAALDDGIASPEDLIEGADLALYRAKAEGRNRVCIHARDRSIPGVSDNEAG
jgi:diguanylate cyclase (GGDEF)-like protein